MTWIKICGITNLEDALTAVEAGVDALGFVFYEKSPRKVTPATVRKIVKALPREIEKVGVFVDESLRQCEETAAKIGLTGVQSYARARKGSRRQEKPVFTNRTKKYAALPANWLYDRRGRYRGFAWSAEFKNHVSAVLLDSATAKRPGGTGKAFDWRRAVSTVEALGLDFKIVVAGGLTPENVGEAMRTLRPWGVDVSSGVEARPGKKDPEKVRAFVAAVRKAEKSL